jgi:hypothetical protein
MFLCAKIIKKYGINSNNPTILYEIAGLLYQIYPWLTLVPLRLDYPFSISLSIFSNYANSKFSHCSIITLDSLYRHFKSFGHFLEGNRRRLDNKLQDIYLSFS